MKNKTSRMSEQLSNMVAIRYSKEADAVIERAFQINQHLCEENAVLSREELKHTREKIYPTISFYKAVSEIIGSQEEAYRLIADAFHSGAKKSNTRIQWLCKIPFIYKLVPMIMTKIIHKVFGEKSGFQMIEHQKRKGTCHIDMKFCPYYSNCLKYDCPELGTVFCDADDIAYGNMHPKLVWGRTKTLARGDDCCDFILNIRPYKNE